MENEMTKTTTTKSVTIDEGGVKTTTVETSGDGGGGKSYSVEKSSSSSSFKTEKYAASHHDTSEIQAPIYPVERTHAYPKDVPKREKSAGADDLKHPVSVGVASSHSFKDTAPAHHEQKKLQGPAYDVEHKHGFTKEDVISEKVITLKGPAYDVTHGHKYPADGKLDNVEAAPHKEMKYPVLDAEHKNVYKPEKGPNPRPAADLTGPKFQVERQHQFTGMDMKMIDDELVAAKKISTDLVGPVYEVDGAMNHFKEVIMHAEAIRTLQGPVYDADRDHHFKALVVHAHELKNLQGPVYDTGGDRSHQFQQLVVHAHELKTLMGPVYGGEKSSYQPPIDKKEVEMPINGPVYKGVTAKNQYNPQTERIKQDPQMYGPKLPVQSDNKYQPMDTPEVHPGKLMAGPAYRGIDIQHYSDYSPDMVQKPGDPPMLGPKLPFVESSHKYGPVPPRREHTEELSHPVYHGVEVANQERNSSTLLTKFICLLLLTFKSALTNFTKLGAVYTCVFLKCACVGKF
jgi:hypothetical protein